MGKSKPNNAEREGSAAQRSADQSTEQQLASGQKPMCRRYPCCMYSMYLVPFRFVGGVC